MVKQDKIETICINGVEYVRKDQVQSEPKKFNDMKYCIVRSRDQGVMCGYVEKIEGSSVVMHEARQMWKWHSTFVLVDLAEKGPRKEASCKFSVAASQPLLVIGACAVMMCTQTAADALIKLEAYCNG